MWINVMKKISDGLGDAEFCNLDNWTKMESLLPNL